MDAQYGICWGEKLIPTNAPTTIVDGLTTSRYLLIKPLSTNLGDLLITSRTGAGTGAGFRLKPADVGYQFDMHGDNTLLQAKATVNGTTLCYIGLGGDGE